MPLTLETSPALVNGLGNSFTTATFSALADSLLVAVVMCFDTTDRPPTNSGTALTWTYRHEAGSGAGRIYTAPNASAQSITVSAEFSSGQGALKVYVFTGHDPVSPVGALGAGSSSTNNATVNGYTSTRDGSRGIATAIDHNGLGLPSSTDVEDAWDNPINLDGMSITKSANTVGLNTVTFNLDAGGSGTPDWSWAAVEILPAMVVPRPGHAVHVGQAVMRSTLI